MGEVENRVNFISYEERGFICIENGLPSLSLLLMISKRKILPEEAEEGEDGVWTKKSGGLGTASAGPKRQVVRCVCVCVWLCVVIVVVVVVVVFVNVVVVVVVAEV